MSKLLRVVLPAFLLANMLASSVSAEDQWKHTLVPMYVWGAGIEGTSQLGPISAPVSITFSDALDNLDSSFTVHYEANKGQWGILVDVFHLGLDPESTLPNGHGIGVDLTNNIYELGGIYRPATMNGLEVVFGLRAMEFEMDVSIGPVSGKNVVDQEWVDAFVGVRKHFALSDKAGIRVRGDIGTGDSDFVWNAALLLDYRFNKTISLFGGYRWLDYDYETGSGIDRFTYDVTYQGPAIALSFDW